jgi:hypothetical protein
MAREIYGRRRAKHLRRARYIVPIQILAILAQRRYSQAKIKRGDLTAAPEHPFALLFAF